MKDHICLVPDCTRRRKARGLCHTHYMQLRRKGSLSDVDLSECVVRLNVVSDAEYAADRISSSPNGCWIWIGPHYPNGYGMTRRVRNGETGCAHRFVYQLHRGDIPAGLVLDHLCRNVTCVNPDHLEPVTQSVNMLRDWRHRKAGA